MVNYKNGKIYKIVNDCDDEIYVGSTTRTLCERMAHHRFDAKRANSRVYKKFSVLGVEHFRIILVENFSCNSKEELCAREEHWRTQLNATLNTQSCHTGIDDKTYKAQWYEQRKDDINKARKEHYANNKDEFLQKNKEYREKNREKVLEQKRRCHHANREKCNEKSRLYREAHKAEVAESKKAWYEVHKDEINSKRRAKRLEKNI